MLGVIRGSNSGAVISATGVSATGVSSTAFVASGKTAAVILGCGTAVVRGRTAAAIFAFVVGSSQYDLLQLEPKNKS